MKPAVRIEFKALGNFANNDEVVAGCVIGPEGSNRPGRHILLDPRTDRHMGRIVLHELLHVWHPSWPETRVRRETAKRWKRMTWKEKARVYQLLGSAKIQGEDHGRPKAPRKRR